MRWALQTHLGIVATALWIALGAILCGAGGDDPSRVSVAGTVLLDGKPLEHGTIQFLSSLQAEFPHADVSLIQNGKYAIMSSQFLVPGSYRIQIRSYAQERVPTSIKKNAYELPPEKWVRVPARYNDESVLRVKIQSRGLSKIDFDLKQ